METATLEMFCCITNLIIISKLVLGLVKILCDLVRKMKRDYFPLLMNSINKITTQSIHLLSDLD